MRLTVGLFSVDFCTQLIDLPIAPHFVAQSPVFDVVGFGMAVGSPQVGVLGVLGAIAVVEPGQGFVEGTCTKVQAQIRLGSDDLAPLHELIGAKLIGLDSTPCQLGKGRPFVSGSYTVLPVISCTEVAAYDGLAGSTGVRIDIHTRVAKDRDVEGLEGFNDIQAEAVFIDEVLIGILRIVDATVDASSHVLSEARVDVAVDGVEAMLGEDVNRRRGRISVGRHDG